MACILDGLLSVIGSDEKLKFLLGNKEFVDAISSIKTDDKSRPYYEKGTKVNHSGGAIGVDGLYGNVALAYGIKSNHFYRETTKNPPRDGNVAITDAEYAQGIIMVAKAAKLLGRKVIDKFLPLWARNWMQVKNADGVYAIAEIDGTYVDGDTYKAFKPKSDDDKVTIKGGTGWAVAMAEIEYANDGRPIYVFVPSKAQWFRKNFESGDYVLVDGIPKLEGNFAGIGTRDIESKSIEKGKYTNVVSSETTAAVKAVIDLFEEAYGVTNVNIPLFVNKAPIDGFVSIKGTTVGVIKGIPNNVKPFGEKLDEFKSKIDKIVSGETTNKAVSDFMAKLANGSHIITLKSNFDYHYAQYLIEKSKEINTKVSNTPEITKGEVIDKQVSKSSKETQTTQSGPTETFTKGKLLQWHSGAKTITDIKGSATFKVDSVNTLIQLSNEYDQLIEANGVVQSVKGITSNTTSTESTSKDTLKGMLKDMLDLKFVPITVKFSKTNVDSPSDKAVIPGNFVYTTNTMTLTGNTKGSKGFHNPSPLYIVGHEYGHAITAKVLNENPTLKARVTKLMEFAKAKVPGIQNKVDTTRAFDDEAEFMAEVLINEELQKELASFKYGETISILDAIKKIFKTIYSLVKTDGTTGLDYALAVAYEINTNTSNEVVNVKATLSEQITIAGSTFGSKDNIYYSKDVRYTNDAATNDAEASKVRAKKNTIKNVIKGIKDNGGVYVPADTQIFNTDVEYVTSLKRMAIDGTSDSELESYFDYYMNLDITTLSAEERMDLANSEIKNLNKEHKKSLIQIFGEASIDFMALDANDFYNRYWNEVGPHSSTVEGLGDMILSGNYVARGAYKKLLEHIINSSEDEVAVEYAKAVLNIANTFKGNENLKVSSYLDTFPGIKDAAYYDPNSNVIRYIDPAHLDNPFTLIHEIVHGLSINAIDNMELAIQMFPGSNEAKIYADLFKDIDFILNDVAHITNYVNISGITEMYDKDEGGSFYGFTNRYEFLSEFMSNKFFREFLKSVYPNGTKISIYNKIRLALAKLFGLSSGNVASMFDIIDSKVHVVFALNKNSTGDVLDKASGRATAKALTKEDGSIITPKERAEKDLEEIKLKCGI